jgi:hypothetical protein
MAYMRSTPLLIEATPLDGYAVHVRFEDGVAADMDLAYLLDYGGVFEPLRDPGYFRTLRADTEAGALRPTEQWSPRLCGLLLCAGQAEAPSRGDR